MTGFSLKMLPKGRIGLAWRFFLGRLAGWAFPGGRWQRWLLRRLGVKIGEGVFIAPGVILDPVNPGGIEIGDEVFLSWGVQLFAHCITPNTKTGELETRTGKIIIEDRVFFGGFAFATVIAGNVRIGHDTVIASHAFIDADVPPHSVVVGGHPFRIIRTDFHWAERRQK